MHKQEVKIEAILFNEQELETVRAALEMLANRDDSSHGLTARQILENW